MMAEKVKFKFKDIQPIVTSCFWSDLIDGGYIKPEEVLEEDQAKEVKEAVTLLAAFFSQLENEDLIEFI